MFKNLKLAITNWWTKRKIAEMSEARELLSNKLSDVYGDIETLELAEKELLEQGKRAPTDWIKRRLAAQIAQLRRDLVAQHTAARITSRQVGILNGNINNLGLVQQLRICPVPDAEELLENRVAAEELVEQLTESTTLIDDLQGPMNISASSDEAAILQELGVFDSEKTAPPKVSDTKQSELGQPATVAAEKSRPEKVKA